MGRKSLIDPEGRYADIIEPVVNDMGCRLVRVILTSGRQGQPQNLQILVEPHQGGNMKVDDCADISRALSAVMDVEDPIKGAYTLEVSSPGMDRPLTRFEDFTAAKGHKVKLELRYANDEGQKRFRGILQETNEDPKTITMDLEGQPEPTQIEFEDIGSAKIVISDEMIREALNKQDTNN